MIRIPELGKPEESGRLPGSVVGTVNGHGGEDLRLELGSLASAPPGVCCHTQLSSSVLRVRCGAPSQLRSYGVREQNRGMAKQNDGPYETTHHDHGQLKEKGTYRDGKIGRPL